MVDAPKPETYVPGLMKSAPYPVPETNLVYRDRSNIPLETPIEVEPTPPPVTMDLPAALAWLTERVAPGSKVSKDDYEAGLAVIQVLAPVVKSLATAMANWTPLHDDLVLSHEKDQLHFPFVWRARKRGAETP